jgi:hypothetical protein
VNKLNELYYESENDSTLRKLASEVKETIENGTPQSIAQDLDSSVRRLLSEVGENKAISFGDLTGAL